MSAIKETEISWYYSVTMGVKRIASKVISLTECNSGTIQILPSLS